MEGAQRGNEGLSERLWYGSSRLILVSAKHQQKKRKKKRDQVKHVKGSPTDMIWLSLAMASFEGRRAWLCSGDSGPVSIPNPLLDVLGSKAGEVGRVSCSRLSSERLDLVADAGGGGAGDRGCWCMMFCCKVENHIKSK